MVKTTFFLINFQKRGGGQHDAKGFRLLLSLTFFKNQSKTCDKDLFYPFTRKSYLKGVQNMVGGGGALLENVQNKAAVLIVQIIKTKLCLLTVCT